MSPLWAREKLLLCKPQRQISKNREGTPLLQDRPILSSAHEVRYHVGLPVLVFNKCKIDPTKNFKRISQPSNDRPGCNAGKQSIQQSQCD
jgi:hypothetical protein